MEGAILHLLSGKKSGDGDSILGLILGLFMIYLLGNGSLK